MLILSGSMSFLIAFFGCNRTKMVTRMMTSFQKKNSSHIDAQSILEKNVKNNSK